MSVGVDEGVDEDERREVITSKAFVVAFLQIYISIYIFLYLYTPPIYHLDQNHFSRLLKDEKSFNATMIPAESAALISHKVCRPITNVITRPNGYICSSQNHCDSEIRGIIIVSYVSDFLLGSYFRCTYQHSCQHNEVELRT